jgi:membrane protein YqaA with SNARE-associated domain
MLRRAYNWTMEMASRPRAMWALAAVSFTESSFFPVPPDAMLIPMVLAKPHRAWHIALVCTIASVVGGMFGYAIGYFLWEAVGQKVIAFYHLETQFVAYTQAFNEWGLWIILIKGLTPIPYKLVTIASGVAKFDLLVFTFASIATRGLRFFMVAALLRWVGEPIREFIEKYLTWVTTAFVVLLVGGFVAIKYI